MAPRKRKVDKAKCDSRANSKQGTSKMAGRKRVIRVTYSLVPQIRLKRLSPEELSMSPVQIEQTRNQPYLSKEELFKGSSSANSCSKCGKIFAGYTSLYNHMRFMHLNPNSFKCSLCQKAFNYKYLLDNHRQNHHKDTFLYNCDKCNFGTNYKLTFGNHTGKCKAKDLPKVSRMSLGNCSKEGGGEKGRKPYKELFCPSCPLVFDSRSALFNHLHQNRHKDCAEQLNNSLKNVDNNPKPHTSLIGSQEATATQKTAEQNANDESGTGAVIMRSPSERIKNRRVWNKSCVWNCCGGAEHSKKPDTDNSTTKGRACEKSPSKPTTTTVPTKKSKKHPNSESMVTLPYVVIKRLSLEPNLQVEVNNSKCTNSAKNKSPKTLKKESQEPFPRKTCMRSLTSSSEWNAQLNQEELNNQSEPELPLTENSEENSHTCNNELNEQLNQEELNNQSEPEQNMTENPGNSHTFNNDPNAQSNQEELNNQSEPEQNTTENPGNSHTFNNEPNTQLNQEELNGQYQLQEPLTEKSGNSHTFNNKLNEHSKQEDLNDQYQPQEHMTENSGESHAFNNELNDQPSQEELNEQYQLQDPMTKNSGNSHTFNNEVNEQSNLEELNNHSEPELPLTENSENSHTCNNDLNEQSKQEELNCQYKVQEPLTENPGYSPTFNNELNQESNQEELNEQSDESLTEETEKVFTCTDELTTQLNGEGLNNQSEEPSGIELTNGPEAVNCDVEQTPKLFVGDVPSVISSDILTESDANESKLKSNVPIQVPENMITNHSEQVNNTGNSSKCNLMPIKSTKEVVVKTEIKVEYDENQCHLCFVTCWNKTALINHLKRHRL